MFHAGMAVVVERSLLIGANSDPLQHLLSERASLKVLYYYRTR